MSTKRIPPELSRKKLNNESGKAASQPMRGGGVQNVFRLEESIDKLLIDLHYTLGRPKVKLVEEAIKEYAKKFQIREAPQDFYTTKPRNKKE